MRADKALPAFSQTQSRLLDKYQVWAGKGLPLEERLFVMKLRKLSYMLAWGRETLWEDR